ncbi:PKD domain-containing protein [Flavobacterium sp. ALJ2]|uniref:PKD domain-containing protein n=1 Tax=Flavobacterium sp. ALJ2 TaxID=2786960 RepID=UPI00189E1214|nr:PKD domain-containing protein [Flavobacterium sp. ALJ2]MBF7090800.1 PKD domain-containing protein [Flavobacterium sp. ALJ2]
MRKIYFLHLYFLLITTTSVHAFGAVNKNDFTSNKGYENLVLVPNVDFNFTNDETCSGTLIVFTPVVSGTAPFSYKWDFGDGETSTESSPSHSFKAVGCGTESFSVKLTVTDASGENSITKTILVKQKPDLKFVNEGSTSFNKCADNNSNSKYTINVVNNSDSIGCITSYNVSWGDGSSETNVTFPKAHEYQNVGSFDMVITGIGNNGCSNDVRYVVKNSSNPVGALFAPGNTTNLCLPVGPMNFEIGGWGLNPSDTEYLVNYGDGTEQSYKQEDLERSPYYNAANPKASENFPIPHEFIKANCPFGNEVKVTIKTSCDKKILTVGPITILAKPEISFDMQPVGCVETPVQFINTSTEGYTNNCSTIDVYTWDFGDGTPVSREINPTHVYTTPGRYTVILKATTACGTGSEMRKEICIEPILEPSFTFNNTFGNFCTSRIVHITNTTDTSLACSTESYKWEVTNYVEGLCGKESVPGTGIGQWNFANGTNSSSKDPVFNFTLSGTYSVKLTTINSCREESYITKEISVEKEPVITINPISDYCDSATIHPVGTVEQTCSLSSEITYLWDFPGGIPSSSTSLDPGPIYYATSGNYVATFSVTNSCGTTSKEAPFSVNLVLSPVINDKTARICSDTSFEVTPVNNEIDYVPEGTTYVWSTPEVSPAGAVSGANAQSSPRLNISQTLINNTANPATVTYTVSPISGACPGPNFTITVTVDPLITVAPVTKNTTCFGSNDGSITISVTGGIPFATGTPYLFSWTGPDGFTSTDKDIFNLKAGMYYLKVTDNGDCPFTKSYSVTEPDEFRFSGGKNDITCFGLNNGSINLSATGGTPPYTYVWTKDGNPYPETTSNINNLGPGKYDFTITEVNNCNILTDSYTIIEPPLLKVKKESQVDISCYGYYTGEINVSTMGGQYTELSPGVFNYRYSWTGPDGFSSNLQNLKGLAAGTYNLTVTDNSGCTDELEVVLLQNDEIHLEYTKTEIGCYDDANASITIDRITGGVPFATGDPYIIEWSNLGTGLVQNNLSAGTYVITITDALDCPKVFTIDIVNVPVFTINPDVKNVSCFGANDGYIRLNLVGGVAPVKLVWDDNSTAGVERNNIGPGSYKVTITDGTPCEIIRTFKISEPSLLELSAVVSNPLDCADANTGEINLVVTGGLAPFTYSWSNGAKTEDLRKLPPGIYAVTVTDANGCNKSEEWEITRFDQLTPTIEVLTDFDCETKYVHQTFIGHVKGGIPPYTLSWSDGVVSGSNNEIMNTENKGLIIFSVTDSFGCTADFPYNVNTPVLGIANYSTSSYGKDVYDLYSIYDPILFTNLATGDFTNISWDFGDGKFSNEENPKHIYTRVGTYTIKQTVTYPFGCQYSYTSTLVVEKGYSLVIPNAFTPNNDGYNDTFAPVFLGFDSITLDVYDTWGGIVYSETGKNISGWNGQIKNHAAENGNYFFKITAKTFYNHTITERGAFTLLK